MSGTDDKIKGAGRYVRNQVGGNVRLEPQFHADSQVDPVLVLLPQREEGFPVGSCVKGKIHDIRRSVEILMVGDAESRHSQGDGPLNLKLWRRVGVGGEAGVQMRINICHDGILFPDDV